MIKESQIIDLPITVIEKDKSHDFNCNIVSYQNMGNENIVINGGWTIPPGQAGSIGGFNGEYYKRTWNIKFANDVTVNSIKRLEIWEQQLKEVEVC